MDDLTLTQLFARMDAHLEQLVTLHSITNTRLDKMTQQLDRTDATHAGISRTLVGLTTTLEKQTALLDKQTQVLATLQTTLERWLTLQGNGTGT